jgi:AmmeMemoRadiSam system protein B
MRVRPPAVAGSFYPDDPVLLAGTVDGYLADAPRRAGATPRALVAPHAGYVYSGPVAGSAFGTLRGAAGRFRRVLLLGPSHYVAIAGLALPAAEAFETPLGRVALDPSARSALADLPQVRVADAPHAREHSLEVELPFLQRLLGEFLLVPLAAGDATDEEVAQVLERLADDTTLVVVSTDLSHYLPYEAARRADRRTSDAIEALRPEAIGDLDACGRVPLRGLLRWARARGLACERLDLRNSGDTAGPPERVVGYGAYAFA